MTKLYGSLEEVRRTSRTNTLHSRYLSIDEACLDRLNESFATIPRPLASIPSPIMEMSYPQQVGLILMFGCINYCFVDPGTMTDYIYDSEGKKVKRSGGVICALTKSSFDWSDLSSLSQVTRDEWRTVLQLNRSGVVLFDDEERVRRLQTMAAYLNEKVKYISKFFDIYANANAVHELLHESGLFDDVFHKRCQIVLLWLGIVASDANIAFDLKKDLLTAMADYRLPQTLCHLGVIRLTPEGEELLRNEITDREFERDMRSAAIEICSRIAFATGMSSADVDTILWNLSQDLIASGAMSVPAMRVVTRSY